MSTDKKIPEDVVLDILGPEDQPSKLLAALAADLSTPVDRLRPMMASVILMAEEGTLARTVQDVSEHVHSTGVLPARSFAQFLVARIEWAVQRKLDTAAGMVFDALLRAVIR